MLSFLARILALRELRALGRVQTLASIEPERIRSLIATIALPAVKPRDPRLKRKSAPSPHRRREVQGVLIATWQIIREKTRPGMDHFGEWQALMLDCNALYRHLSDESSPLPPFIHALFVEQSSTQSRTLRAIAPTATKLAEGRRR